VGKLVGTVECGLGVLLLVTLVGLAVGAATAAPVGAVVAGAAVSKSLPAVAEQRARLLVLGLRFIGASPGNCGVQAHRADDEAETDGANAKVGNIPGCQTTLGIGGEEEGEQDDGLADEAEEPEVQMNDDGAVAPLEEGNQDIQVEKGRADEIDLWAAGLSASAGRLMAGVKLTVRSSPHHQAMSTPTSLLDFIAWAAIAAPLATKDKIMPPVR